MRILGISGSLREGSYTTSLLRATADLVPTGSELELWSELKGVPPFDEDDEHAPAPAVVELRSAIAGADAVLIVTPEYNSSLPGQLKNALDWASRPHATNPFRNKPVAVVGASPGGFGAVWAQADARRILARMGARVVGPEIAVAHVPSRFDERGLLVDELTVEQLGSIVGALADAVEDRELVAA